ncbi:MAG: metallophosphoesterase [Bacteroidales bacterium]|nr:metallophosphoesterase [Bacteroidales bacterium]
MRIVHFSDFHLQGGYDRDRCVSIAKHFFSILVDINNAKKIDLVIFSGDMVEKGGLGYNNVYEALKDFERLVLDGIVEAIHLEKSHIIFVPGNHEVCRDAESPEHEAKMYSISNNPHSLDEFLYSENPSVEMARLAEYDRFEKEYYEAANADYVHDPFESVIRFQIEGRAVGISMLNTSWRCGKQINEKGEPLKDDGRIVAGKAQIIRSREQLDGCTVKIGVAHHHYSFMADHDVLRGLVLANFDFYFSGHKHSSDEERVSRPEGRTCFFSSAGTLANNITPDGEDYRNGFYLIDIDMERQIMDADTFAQGDDELFHKDRNTHWHEDLSSPRIIQPIQCSLLTQQYEHGYIENELLRTLKGKVQDVNERSIQIVALSGLGKTRLLYEAFKREPNINSYYCEIKGRADTLLQEFIEILKAQKGITGLLIADNCDNALLSDLIKARNSYNPNFRVIGVNNDYYDIRPFEGSPIFITPDDFKDVIKGYVESNVPVSHGDDSIQKQIIKLSDGFPVMAVKLVNAYRTENAVDVHQVESLLPAILKLEDGDDRMVAMKSLALFQPLPYDNGRDKCYRYVVNNDIITPLYGKQESERFHIFFKTIQGCKGKLIETSDMWINVRPLPLAVWLVSKWFDECDSFRMEKLIDELQNGPDDIMKPLTANLCKRIEYMQDNEQAAILFDELTKPEFGPFCNEKVVCSDTGSRLFLAMSVVNPVAISKCLYYIFQDKDFEWIKLYVTGDARRNLVWALEKLCYDDESFEFAVKVLAIFSLAENEGISNNASGQLLQLFHIMIPGTSANLKVRLRVIQFFKSKGKAYNSLLLKVINSAFMNGHFTRMGGAEQYGFKKRVDYSPQNNSEIFDYWNGCKEILIDWIDKDPNIIEGVAEIIQNNTNRWCNDENANLMLPLIEKIAALKSYEWEKEYEILVRNKTYYEKRLTPEVVEQIDHWIERLQPKSFLSKFRMAKLEKDVDYRLPYEERVKQLSEKYSPLVNEFLEQRLYLEKKLIANLIQDQGFFEPYMCIELKKKATDEQSVALYNTLYEVTVELKGEDLRSFFFLLCNAYRGTNCLSTYLNRLKDNHFTELYSRILADIEDDKLTSFKILLKDFDKKELDSSFVDIYLRNIGCCSNDMMKVVIETIQDKFPDKNKQLMGFVQRFKFRADIKEDESLIPLFKNIIIYFPIEPNAGNENYEYASFAKDLLEKQHDEEFAKAMNKKLIHDFNSNYLHGNFEGIYGTLVEQYTNVVWDDFVKAFLSDDYIEFSMQIRHELGSASGFSAGPLFRIDDDRIKKMCEDYPDKAPTQIAGMIPVFHFEKQPDDSVTSDRFSDLFIWLLDEFGDKKDVLGDLHANIGTFSWTGSTIPYYERNIKCFEQLLTHKRPEVRDWATLCINDEKKMLQMEINREDYLRLHYN